MKQEETERKEKLKKSPATPSANVQKKIPSKGQPTANKKSTTSTAKKSSKPNKTDDKSPISEPTLAQTDDVAIKKDHFTADNKDETASNSDESWEKDFDLTDK